MGRLKINNLFERLDKEDIKRVGGKAYHLSELFKLNLPIPHGFVIPTEVFKIFLENSENCKEIQSLLENEITYDNLIEISEQIQNLIINTELPDEVLKELKKAWIELSRAEKVEHVAVRSSATVEDSSNISFAGQADTLLCINNLNNLFTAIKQCWASLYSTRATMYCLTNNISIKNAQMAIIVQKMVNSDVSGVLFTADVVNKDPNKILINSTWGFGETIADGKVEPDEILMDKGSLKILNYKIGKKELMSIRNPKTSGTILIKTPEEKQNLPCLSEEQLIELGKISLKIEKHFKCYQDIEFAIENNEIRILQARPVTTM